MDYEKFMENYSKELQILDAIDLLQHFAPDALDCLDQLGVGSKVEKIYAEHDQTDPTL